MGKRARDRAMRKLLAQLEDRVVVEALVEGMRMAGYKNSEAVPVTTQLTSGKGDFVVRCWTCGRSARSPVDPGTRKATCPACIRESVEGGT